MTSSGESDPNNNCSTGVRVTIPSPDLVVESPSVDRFNPRGRGPLHAERQGAQPRQGGLRRDNPALLPIGRLHDINRRMTEVGTDSVSRPVRPHASTKSPSRTVRRRRPRASTTTAPAWTAVTGESDTDNNCSRGVRVTDCRSGPGHSIAIGWTIQPPRSGTASR